jgi:hypothetical protein
MKTIAPVSIWVNGVIRIGIYFKLICIEDNLLNFAKFQFFIQDAEQQQITTGNLTMNLPDYTTDWVTNDAAYNWAATQLGLTITGNYIAPVL